jgi:capsular polysaccharide biosynthesis protein/Mrp family chromosome partitioning ATPase
VTTSDNQVTRDDSSFSDLASLLDDTPQETQLKLDLKRLLWGTWQRRIAIVLTTLVSSLVAIVLAIFLFEPTWEGRTTLLKKEQQDEFRVGRHGLPFKLQEYAFKTLLDTLLLPGTVQQALQRSGLNMPPIQFARLVSVNLNKESKAFTIGVRWNDPVMAAELANNLAGVFVERNQDLRRSEIETSLLKYRDRFESSSYKATAIAEDLRVFEKLNKISDIDMEMSVMLENRQAVEVYNSTLDANVRAKMQGMLSLQDSINAEPKMIVQSSYFSNPMKKDLSELEGRLAQARGRYTDDNPKVKDLLQRIDKIQTVIQNGKDDQAPSETYVANPIVQELSVTRYETGSEVVLLQTQLATSKLLLEDLNKRIGNLSKIRKQHETLRNKLQNAQSLQNDLRERVESLTVMMQGVLGDFEVLEAASIPTRHESSGKKLFVVAIFVLAVGVSVAGALLLEFFNVRIRTMKDLGFAGDFTITAEFETCSAPDISADSEVSLTAMQFRRFANDLQVAMQKSNASRIAFASIEGDSGATTVARNTAISMSSKDESITLVDADLRQNANNIEIQSIHAGDDSFPSLLELLEGDAIPLGPRSRLHLVKAATKAPRQAENVLQIGGKAMAQIRQSIEQLSEYTFYNLPPIKDEEAAFEALKNIGKAILVVRSGKSSKQDIDNFIIRMNHHGIEVVAAVIVDVPHELMSNGMIEPFKNLQSDFIGFANWSAGVYNQRLKKKELSLSSSLMAP